MGGFDIDVGNGESSNWQWQEEQQQQWNQSNLENSWESNWESNSNGENTWQNGEDTTEIPAQGDQGQDSGYQYNTDTGNGAQDNTQWWDDQYQVDDNDGQTVSQTGNEDVSEISGEIVPTLSPMPTSTMTPSIGSGQTSRVTETPRVTEIPKATETPKPTQTPTPEATKKKIKKKQNGRNETGKENKNTDNSKDLKNGDDQGDTVKYMHAKDETVEFQCTQNPGNSHIPQIQIISKGSVQVLSFRMNGTESPWHWEKDWIVSDAAVNGDANKVELLVVSQGGKLIKMEPWIFSS